MLRHSERARSRAFGAVGLLGLEVHRGRGPYLSVVAFLQSRVRAVRDLTARYQRSKRRIRGGVGQRRVAVVMVGGGSSMCGGSQGDVGERQGASLPWPVRFAPLRAGLTSVSAAAICAVELGLVVEAFGAAGG